MKKSRKTISWRAPEDIYAQLERLVQASGVPTSRIIELCVEFALPQIVLDIERRVTAFRQEFTKQGLGKRG